MRLCVQSPLVFLVKILKWSLLFALIVILKAVILQEIPSFLTLLAECAKTVCISFPVLYSLAFMGTLGFLMKKERASICSSLTLLIPLVLIVLFLQPFLYSVTQRIVGLDASLFPNTPMNHFIEPAFSLKELAKEVYHMSDDWRQAYFEGYRYYLFFTLAYLYFLFSLATLIFNARWKLFNYLFILIILRALIALYSIMNNPDYQIYIFSFSTIQLSGIPTYIIMVGLSSIIYLYGILSSKRKGAL